MVLVYVNMGGHDFIVETVRVRVFASITNKGINVKTVVVLRFVNMIG